MFKHRRSPEKRKHLAGLVRVFAYVSGVGVVCGALSIRAARAEVADQSIVVGRQMLEMVGTSSDVSHVSLNGQQMFLGSALSKDEVATVLDRYEQHCKKNGAQSPESWRELSKTPVRNSPDSAATLESFNTGIIRSGDEREGTIICFVRSSQSKASVADALKSFGETGELGALGQLRYAYAKKTEKGNTHILTGWTLDKFNVSALTPPDSGDVGGADFPEMPRPNDSQRVLSARVEGTPFGLNVYRSDVAPAKVAEQFDEAMTKAGWFALDTEIDKRQDTSQDKAVGHLYEKDGVVLTLASSIQQGKTISVLGLAGVQAEARNNR